MAVEDHEDWGDGTPSCIGQWCCGCPEHPIGKPWGWNYQAWSEHYTTCLKYRNPSPSTGATTTGGSE